MYYILFYDFVENYLEKRTPYRAAHFDHITPYVNNGQLRLGGAFANPADKAALVFYVDSRGIIEEFVKADPYYLNGLIRDYSIREWTVVVGKDFIKQ